jgi:hypothetical protein
VFYQLAEIADSAPADPNDDQQGQEVLGVWSRGTFFPLDPTGAA